MDLMEGVSIQKLKQIEDNAGAVYHILKKQENSFDGFGEAYFSIIKTGEKKGWKKHLDMTCNLIVASGRVKFVIYDDREDSSTKGKYNEFILSSSKTEYQRLTIKPNLWFAFMCLSNSNSMILNIANIQHSQIECLAEPINSEMFSVYEWE